MAISVENCKFFPPPRILRPDEGFPLELGIGAGGRKTRIDGAKPGRERSSTISSAVWIQYTKAIDGWTDTRRQQRPRLHIAWRGKYHSNAEYGGAPTKPQPSILTLRDPDYHQNLISWPMCHFSRPNVVKIF